MKYAWILMVLMAVCPMARAAEASDQENVVILLDGSGSMSDKMGQETRMDAAKDAIVEVLKNVPQSTQVGLVVFSEGSPHGWIHPLGPRNDVALLNELKPVRPGGGTPLGEYIKVAADRLLKQREEQLGYGSYRLVVVTDGEASDSGRMRAHAMEVVARGIVTDVIGVDMKQDHLLASLAHSYRRADDPKSLRSALREILGEVAGPGTDAATDEAFPLLQGLPDGASEKILAAFATTRNTPIGGKPAYKVGTHQPTPTSPSSRKTSNFSVFTLFCVFVGLAIGIKMLVASARD